MVISVILCTHNPRPDYLARTLDALKTQTLPNERWELLLIDNASKESLAISVDISWHPHARQIREDELGITPARLRGIKEVRGELLVFVDDDNVLQPDYLEKILEIRGKMPFMEVFGSGNIIGEFETPPEDWMKPYLPMLALRELAHDLWSNAPMRMGFNPCGAGLCVTRKVANAHVEMLKQDPRRKQLGCRGSDLLRGEDDDICFTAASLGVGVGMFKSLSLTHLIPSTRLNEAYLLRLSEGMIFSSYILSYLWQKPLYPPAHSFRWRFGYWRMRRKMQPIQRRFADAQVRAEARVRKAIRLMRSAVKDNQV